MAKPSTANTLQHTQYAADVDAGIADIDVTVGNAGRDQDRGWFIGQFVNPALGFRHCNDVEIKWGVHPPGDVRSKGWSLNRTSTTISILIKGEIYISFRVGDREKSVCLKEQGDYVIFPPGVQHTWHSDVETLVLTVRTPSVPDDQEHFE